jgi:hypothetical protein
VAVLSFRKGALGSWLDRLHIPAAVGARGYPAREAPLIST